MNDSPSHLSTKTSSRASPVAWIASIFHIFIFLCILFGYQLPLMLARCFSRRFMDNVLAYHCLSHLGNIRMTGARFTIKKEAQIDPSRPLILVSNHQAMYDIPLIIWSLRDRAPKFIAKKELKRWIPSISFALRWGDHLIIDRSRGKQALTQIREYGKHFEDTAQTVCIFPEGTRSSEGNTRSFKPGGFVALVESMPSAQIIPLTLDGTGFVVKNNLLPVGINSRILLHVHPERERAGKTPQELLQECEQLILSSLEEWRKGA